MSLNLRKNKQEKKVKLSSDIDNPSTAESSPSLGPEAVESKPSSALSPSPTRTLAPLTDSTYISYPPRRYIFSGAEVYPSSSSDDESDEEELPRKNLE